MKLILMEIFDIKSSIYFLAELPPHPEGIFIVNFSVISSFDFHKNSITDVKNEAEASFFIADQIIFRS